MAFLDNVSQKNRQRLRILAVIAVVIAASFILSSALNKKKLKHAPPPKRGQVTVLKDKIDKDAWIQAEGDNVRSLQKQSDEILKAIEAMKEENKSLKTEIEQFKQGTAKPAETGQPAQAQTPGQKKKAAVLLKTPLPASQAGVQPQKGNEKPEESEAKKTAEVIGGRQSTHEKAARGQRGASGTDVSKAALHGKDAKGDGVEAQGGGSIRVFRDSGGEKKKASDTKANEAGLYIPAGSFMKATLLNGIDAPTAGSAQQQPYPVLLTVSDLTWLPNKYRMSLIGCNLIGAGFGNSSDERAYIRIETLSCVRTDGKVLETELKAQVIGEDGKLGLRGRFQSKQGQQIFYSIISGTLASFGNALRPQNTLSLNLGGTSSTTLTTGPPLTMGQGLEAAAGGGAGIAMDKVADFYLKNAEKLYPIIEIDADRHVEVLILKGQKINLMTRK